MRESLEMHVIGSRGSTLRAVIENGNVRITCQNAVHFRIIVQYALRLMGACRNGEMHRHYGVWIDKQLKLVVQMFYNLTVRPVAFTQEARPAAYLILAHMRPGGNHARRIELQCYVLSANGNVARQHVMQVAEIAPGHVPGFKLPVEKPQ